MAVTLSVASANKFVNQSRFLLQDALDKVAAGRQQLQNEVDAGRLTPGTQEFLDARNRLVNSAQSFADTLKSQYDQDLANLEQAQQAESSNTVVSDSTSGPVTQSRNNTVSPQVDPEAQQTDSAQTNEQIIPADQVTPNEFQEAGNTDGYGSQNEVAVPIADVRTAPSIIGDEDAQQFAFTTGIAPGDEDAQQRPFQTFAAPGDEDAQQAAFRSSEVQVGTIQAQNQQTNASLAQATFPQNNDWRVTLRLAPNANYLYKAGYSKDNPNGPGILAPLAVTNGVVFPYTPAISTAYKADYSSYDLIHSNYRGYFYKNSYMDQITMNATFTAQSTSDAQYVLAVIHFFRSVTKMFYGQDAQKGSPPPLVFLSGLGDFQYNNHPCLVSQFNYKLPADVDYISSGTPNNLGLNLAPLQNLFSTTINSFGPTAQRLAQAFLPPGAQNALPAPLQQLINSNPTYVPSKIDIDLILYPVQTRQQVSTQFSLKNFASGQLLRGGFW